MAKKQKSKNVWLWIISEVAFYFFFWYALWLLEVDIVNLWAGALVLWILINASMLFCPVVKKCYKG